MKPKQLRRFIKRYLTKHPYASYQTILKAVWGRDMDTPVKRIDRALRKMARWGKIQVADRDGVVVFHA